MGESAAKFRPEVDLDEFERRLRAAAPAASQQTGPQAGADPLAELARLVGGEQMNKRSDPFEALFRAQNAIHEVRDAARGEQAPQQAYSEQAYAAQRFAGEPSYPSHGQNQAAGGYRDDQNYADSDPRWAPESSSQAYAGEQDWPAAFSESAPPPAPRLRRKVMTAMAAVLALGVAGLAGALVMRGKSTGGDVVTIQADPDPAKVKPPQADAAAAPAGQALFDRKAGQDVAKVVANTEQPADLAVKIKNAPVAAPTPPAAGQAQSDSIFPTPKKVKTVAVRADGSMANAPAQPPAPPPRSSLPSMAANLPAGVTPAAPAAKTAERAAPVAKPAAVAKPAPVAKPAAAEAAEPAGAGGFAVQLAGTPSESEAREAATRLSAKYASALQGHKASFVSAQVGDKTVYRVRVGKLSEDGAKTMCAAIKGQGGACFVTKN